MALKKNSKKGLLVKALEDGVLKAVELSAVGAAIGLSLEEIAIASAAVFMGSLAFKIVKCLI